MSIKITIPNTSSDVLTFGSANTPTAAQIAGIDSGSSNGQLALYTTASGTSTERVRVDASGNVGIGTSSPAQKLEVNGGAAAGFMRFASTLNSTGFDMGVGGTADPTAYIYNRNNTPLLFATNNIERMRIDSSGNLLVGTTTASGRLTVSCDPSATARVALFSSTYSGGDSAYEAIGIIKYANSTATSNIFQRFFINQGGSGSGTINANGANAAAFGTYSDSRLKENIVDLPSQLDNIMALRPVEYDYIESEGGGHQIGFVAQEVQAIYPDLVGERTDGMLTLSDMNKNDARLIKAIQELKALVDAQASTITQLQADVAALKGASA